jgi:hypothetical protein
MSKDLRWAASPQPNGRDACFRGGSGAGIAWVHPRRAPAVQRTSTFVSALRELEPTVPTNLGLIQTPDAAKGDYETNFDSVTTSPGGSLDFDAPLAGPKAVVTNVDVVHEVKPDGSESRATGLETRGHELLLPRTGV